MISISMLTLYALTYLLAVFCNIIKNSLLGRIGLREERHQCFTRLIALTPWSYLGDVKKRTILFLFLHLSLLARYYMAAICARVPLPN